MRDFNKWLNNFRESIADYKFYIDFETVRKNIKKYELTINALDSLIGSKNIEKDFKKLILKNPGLLKTIPALLAKRESHIPCTDEKGTIDFNFNKLTQTADEYVSFMEKTGLFSLLKNRVINSVSDYLVGVETGLNSNARKNRGGHLMENLVEKYLVEYGFIKNKTYFKEMYLQDIEKRFKLNLSNLSNNDQATKRFDFVFVKDGCVFACECNFYSSGGSKLNETARSYKTLALESKNIKKFKFVWFTDGLGWKSASRNLKETFDVLPNLYCIKDLEDGILNKIK